MLAPDIASVFGPQFLHATKNRKYATKIAESMQRRKSQLFDYFCATTFRNNATNNKNYTIALN